MSWYQTKSYTVEAKRLYLHNFDEVETFIGGDAGSCSKHIGCVIFASKQGALHVQIGQYVVKDENEQFSVEDEGSFNSKYVIMQRDPYGD